MSSQKDKLLKLVEAQKRLQDAAKETAKKLADEQAKKAGTQKA